mgnify:CR=1
QLEAVDAYSALRVAPAEAAAAATPPTSTTTSSRGVKRVIQDYLKQLSSQVRAKQIREVIIRQVLGENK